MKKIISGLQATDSLTLGNYIGSIISLVELQNENNLYVVIADLHLITVPIDPKDLEKNRKSIVCLYKACGLDFKKIQFDKINSLELLNFKEKKKNKNSLLKIHI